MTVALESFSSYEFERFYHAKPIEPTRKLAPDYVPEYAWLDSAVAQIRARNEFNLRFSAATPSPTSGESNVTFVTFVPAIERQSARLLLIEARRAIEEAADALRELDSENWNEIAPYVQQIRAAVKAVEREYSPRPLGALRIFKAEFWK